MKKFITILLGFVLLIIVGGAVFFWQIWQGIKPVVTNPPVDINDVIPPANTNINANSNNGNQPQNLTDMPLKLPAGFSISIYANDVPGARDLVVDSSGNIWVSQTGEGLISMISDSGDGLRANAIFRNLDRPHGLAFDPQNPHMLYFAEETKISRIPIGSDASIEKIADLPAGGRHFTRSLQFGADDRMYVSIGSTCDVCREENAEIGTIISMNKDGSDRKTVATGLRNSVFMATNPIDGSLWATEMGRDGLGNNLPPDEINVIETGKFYGWPTCYGQNIHDADFDKNTYIRNPCMEPFETPAKIDLPAHVAPLGLAFIPEEGWPEEYWNDLFVAYHGSWNSNPPVGYKIVHLKLDNNGAYLGSEDFITGWLTSDDRALGRPVDVLAQPGGVMYVSDDKAGVIYKIWYSPSALNDTADLIRIDNVVQNQLVKSPLSITGAARGTWYFEASFPIELQDANGKQLFIGPVQAGGDWMTTEFVPFTTAVTFVEPTTDTGFLIFHRDNPSGLIEQDRQLRIPVRFK